MFTLYRIGFCSVSKVAQVQCEQELIFCCGAEIVPERSQCKQTAYPLCNLQRSLLIWKNHLPKRDSVAISAPIKVFRLDSDRFKNLSDTERFTFNSGAEQYCSGAETSNNEFHEILKCFRKTAKFEFFAKQIIYLASPDHPLQNHIWYKK